MATDNMLKKRPTVESRVKQILQSTPQTRGDDLLLIYYYWRKHDRIHISFQKFQDLFSATSPETIRRSRQKIQAIHWELKPSERVKNKRLKLEQQCKIYYGAVRLTDYGASDGGGT